MNNVTLLRQLRVNEDITDGSAVGLSHPGVTVHTKWAACFPDPKSFLPFHLEKILPSITFKFILNEKQSKVCNGCYLSSDSLKFCRILSKIFNLNFICLFYYLFANCREVGRFQLQGEEAKGQRVTGS